MKVVQIGGAVLFFALIGAALGLAFFRQIDGENLTSLIRDKQILRQQVFEKSEQIMFLNKQISLLKHKCAVDLAQRDEQINELEQAAVNAR